jgi:hypothetical protein
MQIQKVAERHSCPQRCDLERRHEFGKILALQEGVIQGADAMKSQISES